jgi:hypothetical protein
LGERQCSPTHTGEPINNEIKTEDTEPNVLGVASCSASDYYKGYVSALLGAWEVMPQEAVHASPEKVAGFVDAYMALKGHQTESASAMS